jgi:predicted nucleic acid-binding protein
MLTVDTNVLFYSQDASEPTKQKIANEIIAGLQAPNAVFTAVVLGEFFHVASRKLMTTHEARRCLDDFGTLLDVVPYNVEHLFIAAAHKDAGRFAFWDAVMLMSAADAGCTICLSEDMADGARCGKITVRNPFGPRGLAPEIRALLLP